MLPTVYQLPAAILFILGGALTCFAGYRLFRLVLGIYGFILGAAIASSVVGVSNTAGMVMAALLGGAAGALILVFAYFIGIALIGAGVGALVVHAVWTPLQTSDPPALLVVFMAVIGAIGAMLLQRYVIIVSTAFGGAWTLLYGALIVSGSPIAAPAIASRGVWILYPLSPAYGSTWNWVAWIVLGLLGTGIQLGWTAGRR
jgi:hypothetical protein